MRPRTIRRFLHGLDASRSGKQPNFTELELRYLDDSLSEEAVARLDGQLRRDPRMREQFAIMLLNKELLREIGREETARKGPALIRPRKSPSF